MYVVYVCVCLCVRVCVRVRVRVCAYTYTHVHVYKWVGSGSYAYNVYARVPLGCQPLEVCPLSQLRPLQDLLQFTETYSLSDSEAARDQLAQVALHLITRHTTGTTLTTDMLSEK